jgi:DNA-binding transcriptional LysR family regulator
MELRHLRYFHAVATTLNFSRAAESLRVAQPALSRQVKALEAELGVQLFDRNRVRVQITDAGRLFLTHVEKVLAQVDMAVSAVREVREGTEGRLIVCTEWRLPIGLLPKAIAEFRSQFPRVEIDLCELPLLQHLSMLRTGKAHLGFVAKEVAGLHRNLAYLPLLNTELMALLPERHPLAGKPRIRVADLSEEVWLNTGDRSMGYRTYITQTCRLAGFMPRFGRAANTLEGMLGLVGSGFGVTLLPAVMATNQMPAGVCALATDCAPVEIGAIWNEADDSKLLKNFIEILRQAAARVA